MGLGAKIGMPKAGKLKIKVPKDESGKSRNADIPKPLTLQAPLAKEPI